MSPDGGEVRSTLVLGLLAVSTLTGCRSGGRFADQSQLAGPPAQAIVLDNHWHTALIFRHDELPEELRLGLRSVADRKYVMIGWGDEGFFRAERVTAGLTLRALFASRGSVLLVVGFDTPPEATFARGVDIFRVPTDCAAVKKIGEFVSDAFRRERGGLIDLGPGIDGGRFYSASGRYAFYHTCNNWTADALAAGGLPIAPGFATMAGNVAFQLRQGPGVLKNRRTIVPPAQPDLVRLRLARGGRP